MIHRLSRVQLQNSVAELFSTLSDAHRNELLSALQVRFDLIPADSAEGFAQNDNVLAQEHVDAVVGLATAVVAEVSNAAAPYSRDLLAVCSGSTLPDDNCLTAIVQRYGRKAFRRPLTPDEVDNFKAFYAKAAAASSSEALGLLFGRMISHPNFYYRFDNAGDQLSGNEGQDAIYRLTKWELLSKLTLLFWMAPPTDALYDRVAATDITTDAELQAIVEEILNDPRAKAGIGEFFHDWLGLHHTVTPVTTGNTAAGQTLLAAIGLTNLPATHRDDMIQEVLDLATYYSLTTEGKLDDIFTSPYSFARSAALAKIYGVNAWDGNPDHLVRLPEGERSGLLSRAAMVVSNFEYTRPILKGVAVQKRVLCTPTPPPPPNIDIVPVLHVTDKTTRQSTEIATASPLCQGCHQTLNGFGFATEHYDPLGRFRAKESMFVDGKADAASQLDIEAKTSVILPSGKTGDVADAIQFGEFVAQSGEAHACMTKSFLDFAFGDTSQAANTSDLATIRDTLQASSIKQMLRATALLQSFRQRMVR